MLADVTVAYQWTTQDQVPNGFCKHILRCEIGYLLSCPGSRDRASENGPGEGNRKRYCFLRCRERLPRCVRASRAVVASCAAMTKITVGPPPGARTAAPRTTLLACFLCLIFLTRKCSRNTILPAREARARC